MDAIGAAITGLVGFIGGIVDGTLIWVLDTVQAIDPIGRLLFAGIGMFCETSILIGLLIPGDTIVLVASTAIGDPWQYAGTLAAVIVGSLGGESVGFLLGRFFGHRIRDSALGRRIGHRNWIRAERYVARRGGIAVFVSRFLPVLHSLTPVTVGMSAMRYRVFLRWTAPACAIWAAAYVTVGAVTAQSFRQLNSELHWAGYLFVAVIVVFLVAALLGKKVLERVEARHFDDAADHDSAPNDDDGPEGAPSDPSSVRDA